MLLMVKIFLSAFPFCDDVCGQERQKANLFTLQNSQKGPLLNSLPLSH